MSDSGKVCNAPRSSVLFDGIPTLTGLEGDMWASQLLTLNTSTSSASITFDFTNRTGNGPKSYKGVSIIEVVMFNCSSRKIGTSNMQVAANGSTFDNVAAVSESCNYLMRVCSAVFISPSFQPITLLFSQIHPRLYIAEISFYSYYWHQCSAVGPLVMSVVEQTSTSHSNQESSSSKKTDRPTLAYETTKLVTNNDTMKQDYTISLEKSFPTSPNQQFSHIPTNGKTMLSQG